MIGTLLYAAALSAPEIAEAVADGAASLVSTTGTHLGQGIVKGVAEEVRKPETQAAFAEGAAGILASVVKTLTREATAAGTQPLPD